MKKCRLCWVDKSPESFHCSLQSDFDLQLKFLDLVEFYFRIEIDKDIRFPQDVCKVCFDLVSSISNLNHTVSENEKKLKKSKADDSATATLCVKESVNKVANVEHRPLIEEEDPKDYTNDPTSGNNPDEDMDSGTAEDIQDFPDVASECSETPPDLPEPSTRFSLRNVQEFHPAELKICSVSLERLPIVYVKTDTESTDSEDEVPRTVARKTLKRSHNSSMMSVGSSASPNKRMRIISPQKMKPESQPPQVVSTFTIGGRCQGKPSGKKYLELFNEVFKAGFENSKFNLDYPQTAKGPNGAILDTTASSFVRWNSFKTKCIYKCDNHNEDGYKSPYEMLKHNQTVHKNELEEFIQCILCSDGKYFSFYDFLNHAIEEHYINLGNTCVVCSKMFYNYGALYQHYQSTHKFSCMSKVYICLHEGLIYKDYENLVAHMETHEKIVPVKSSPDELSAIQEYQQDVNSNGFADENDLIF